MPGCESSASTLTSRANRPVTWFCSPEITLTATASPEIGSRARNTVPIPPLPIGCSISNRSSSRSPGLMDGPFALAGRAVRAPRRGLERSPAPGHLARNAGGHKLRARLSPESRREIRDTIFADAPALAARAGLIPTPTDFVVHVGDGPPPGRAHELRAGRRFASCRRACAEQRCRELLEQRVEPPRRLG